MPGIAVEGLSAARRYASTSLEVLFRLAGDHHVGERQTLPCKRRPRLFEWARSEIRPPCGGREYPRLGIAGYVP